MFANQILDRVLILARTLAIGVAGGALFQVAGLPVPWLSGPACAVAVAALSRLELAVPNWLKEATFVFLGATMGATVTPETIATLQQWPLSLAGLAVAIFGIMALCAIYLQVVHNFDQTTARLAAVPGALPYVLALSEESDADTRRVAIIQMMRLVCLVMLLPSALGLLGFESGATADIGAAGGEVIFWQLPLVFAAGWLGGFLLERLNAPAAYLFGSMIATALAFGSGTLTTIVPDWIMQPGLVIIGAMVGANFAGTDIGLLRKTALAGFGCLAVGTLVALAVALPVGLVLDLPVAQIWLAYAPGGVETMAIMALALGMDVAFVGGHHVVRFFGLGIFVPIWLRRAFKR